MTSPLAALAATVCSGLLYAAAFPPLGARGLAWVALVPWLRALRSASTGRALTLTWVWSLVAALGLNAWFPGAVTTYYLEPAWVGAAFFVGVTTLTATPAFVLFSLVWRALGDQGPGRRVVGGAAAWVGAEVLRVRLLGDPWGLLGYSQAPTPLLLQVADLGGVYAVSFLCAAMNVAIVEWLERRAERRSWISLAIALGLVGAALGYGGFRLRTIDRRAEVPVAIVQTDPAIGTHWSEAFYGRHFGAALRATADALRRSPTPPELVLWPETSMTFFLEEEPGYRVALAKLLQHTGAQLIAGGPRSRGDRTPPYFNSAFVVGPDGEIVDHYDKRRLLPFAERFPIPSLRMGRRRFGRVREFTAGDEDRPVASSAGAAGALICNEAFFAEPARATIRRGAEFLVVLANDAWIASPTYGAQAFDMAVLRAVELRRWLVRVSTSGPSGIVDPSGRVVTVTAVGGEATAIGAIARATCLSPYARIGDAFAFGCLLLAALAVRRRAG